MVYTSYTRKCHIVYISSGKVLGVSKFARIVDYFARRLQIQENLTKQISGYVQQITKAQAVGVIVEAQQLCMMMRGVEKKFNYENFCNVRLLS